MRTLPWALKPDFQAPAKGLKMPFSIPDRAHPAAEMGPHFYPARMVSGAGKQVFYHAPCALATTLVFFENDLDFQARIDIASVLSAHS